MTESESVALPFGDCALLIIGSFTDFDDYTTSAHIIQGLFYFFAYFVRFTGYITMLVRVSGWLQYNAHPGSRAGYSTMLIPVPWQVTEQYLSRFQGRLQNDAYPGSEVCDRGHFKMSFVLIHDPFRY